jgi:hypothetical protein
MEFAPPTERKEAACVSEMRQNIGGGARPIHPILLPEADVDDEAIDLPATPSAKLPARGIPRPEPGRIARTSWYTTLGRPAAYIASGVAGGGLVIALYGLLGPRIESPGSRSAADVTVGAPAASDVATLDRRADSLSLAIAAFSLRGRMYDTRRMGCAGLSRGLQQVEDAWLAYNMTRKEAAGAADSMRETRDRSLYADIRAVELRFERSTCTRP